MNIYFWINNQVEVLNYDALNLKFIQSSTMHKYLCCPCVDTFWNDTPDQKYGRFIRAIGGVKWVPEPIKAFPLDFRAQLLLLGVA